MKWVLADSDEGAAAALADTAGLHPLIARLMVNRGIVDPSVARSFLSCDLSALSGPGVFSHMEKAADRVRSAIARREKIVIYGDYDVDGVTGTSLLYLALKRKDAVVESYIPDRMTEGYGLNTAALESIKAAGAGLVISVDCGITAVREAEHARSIGLDLIITDHHEFAHSSPGSPDQDAVLPPAYALLHPALTAAGVPEAVRASVAGLTGVGVAFKLAQALLGA
ncbi:MAG TPA: DHH family phosphoesterase, partial [Nitrospirota bacterium]